MNQRKARATETLSVAAGEGDMGVGELFAAARRQSWVVVLWCAVSAGTGYAYLHAATPLFTASTDVMIDPRRINALQEAYATAAIGTNRDAIDSEVQVFQSDRVALRVVDALGLIEDRSFMSPPPSLGSRAASTARRLVAEALQRFTSLASAGASAGPFAGLAPSASGDDAELEAVAPGAAGRPEDREALRQASSRKLRRNMEVARQGNSFVVRVSYTSPSAEGSARIANAYADAYVSEQLEAGLEAAQRASEWLQSRILDIQQRSLHAELAVERFRAENDLIGAGDRPLNEEQLAALNAQLSTARAETAHLAARLRRIRDIIEARDVEGAVSESLNHGIITNLRSRYLEASKRLSELEGRVGPRHQLLARLRAEMQEYQRMMMDELRRLAEGHQSDYEIAKSREESLERSLRGLVGVAETKNESLVALRELEREAATYRALHQQLLERHQEAAQQQFFEISEAKIINRARAPGRPSQPQSATILALALAFGSALGMSFGALREFRDRVFRTREQIRDELNLELLGMLPALSPKESRRRRKPLGAPPAGSRSLRVHAPLMRYVLDAPLSGFAETLRSAKVAADLTLVGRLPRIVGVTSVLAGEGKSTVAKNFASLLAAQGAPTLLIDGDLRNPSLSLALAPEAEEGIIEAVLDARPVEELLHCEQDSQLKLLPALRRRWVSHSGDLLASGGMRALLHQAGRDFTYIVVDLPPIGPVVDVRAAAAQFDAFLLVVEWGRTPRSVVRAALADDETVWSKCLGAVYNKVNPKELRKYEDDASHYFRNGGPHRRA